MSSKVKRTAGKVFSVLGLIMMIAVIIGYLPLTVPKWFGYQIFHITVEVWSRRSPQEV